MKQVKGDLIKMSLAGEFEAIVHGCNCYHAMGRGIAKSIKQTFPEAYQADKLTEKGSKQKLGTISFATVKRNGNEITVINAYTQFHYRGKGVLVDYDHIKKCFQEIKYKFTGKRIGYPKIGAGLAGGDWKLISTIIEQQLQGEDHTLVIYTP